MGKKVAIVIAVEKYADSRITDVRFAEDDAKGFAASLQLGGTVDTVELLSPKATKTTINSQLKLHLKPLAAADRNGPLVSR
jgi:hypothetical protein